jgi:hypothetical protein
VQEDPRMEIAAISMIIVILCFIAGGYAAGH